MLVHVYWLLCWNNMLLNTNVMANATGHILCELTRTYARVHLFPKLSRVHLFHFVQLFSKITI